MSFGSIAPALPPPPAAVYGFSMVPEKQSLVKLFFFMKPGAGDWMGPFVPMWQTSSEPSLRCSTGNSISGGALVLYPDDDDQNCKLILVKSQIHMEAMENSPSIRVLMNQLKPFDDGSVEYELTKRITKKEPILDFSPLCLSSIDGKDYCGNVTQVSRWDTAKGSLPISFNDLEDMTESEIRKLFQEVPVIYLDTESISLAQASQLRRLSRILQVPCYLLCGHKQAEEQLKEPTLDSRPLSGSLHELAEHLSQ